MKAQALIGRETDGMNRQSIKVGDKVKLTRSNKWHTIERIEVLTPLPAMGDRFMDVVCHFDNGTSDVWYHIIEVAVRD